MIDLHCHVLPGVDDGPADWDGALEMMRMADRAGTTMLVATPHSHDFWRAEEAVRALRQGQEKGAFPMKIGPRCLRCPHYRGACPSDYGRAGVL